MTVIKGSLAFQTRRKGVDMEVRATLQDEQGDDLVAWPWVTCEVGASYAVSQIGILLTFGVAEVKAALVIDPDLAEGGVRGL